MSTFSPVIPTAEEIQLGEGIIYINYGTDNFVYGVTSGGSEFALKKDSHDVAVDGAYGKIKGLNRVDTFYPSLKVNLLKLKYTNLIYGFPVTVVDGTDKDGSYKEIQFDIDIASTDVLTNVAFVGENFAGDAMAIIIENALNIEGLKLNFKSKDEVNAEMTFTGFAAGATPTIMPFEIRDIV